MGAQEARLERVELRQSPRVEARFRIWCESQEVTFYARVANVSEGGIFLRTSTPLVTGRLTKLRFSLAYRESGLRGVELETLARVVWARAQSPEGPAGMGLRFESLDEARREILREIVARESRAVRAETR